MRTSDDWQHPANKPHMETLKEAFCRKFSCPPEEFERRALLAALYPHARIFTFLGSHHGDRFILDRAVINYCGSLRSRSDVSRELGEYAQLPENRQFSGRFLRIRVSGRRLQRLAAFCWSNE
jgi:hypothetical protein